MKQFNFPAILIIASVFIIIVNGQDFDKAKCKVTVNALTKKQMQMMTTCTKSLKFKNGKEKAAKSNCILKCVMVEAKILDDQGMLTKENLEVFIKGEAPGEDGLHAKVLELFDPCITDHAANIDPAEEYCKTYEPVIKCLMAKMPNIC